MFMGGEFGQFIEWNENASLDWFLIEEYDMHRRLQNYSRALNKIYLDNKALWQVDFDRDGFQCIDSNDNENSIITFLRKAEDSSEYLIVLSNFSAQTKEGYRIGVPEGGFYEEVLNTDLEAYGGKGIRNGLLEAEEKAYQNRRHSITMRIPPQTTIYLKRAADPKTGGSY